MRALLLSLLLLTAVGVHAGEVNVSWNASEGAAAYKVYVGEDSGTYGVATDVGNVLTHNIADLDDGCKTYYTTITAYNVAGESDYSEEASFIPRPAIDTIVVNPTDANEWLVSGENFSEDVTVMVGDVAAPFTRDGCEALRIPVVQIPGGGDTLTMRVCNGGVCMDYLLVRPARPTGLVPS